MTEVKRKGLRKQKNTHTIFPNIRNQKMFLHAVTCVCSLFQDTHPKGMSVKATEDVAAGQLHDRLINLSIPLFT